jgi:hypothetical protein
MHLPPAAPGGEASGIALRIAARSRPHKIQQVSTIPAATIAGAGVEQQAAAIKVAAKVMRNAVLKAAKDSISGSSA